MFCSFIIWVFIFAGIVGLILGNVINPKAGWISAGGIIFVVILFFVVYLIKMYRWEKREGYWDERKRDFFNDEE
jgi:membrane protein DedA with SNARE-associated domain